MFGTSKRQATIASERLSDLVSRVRRDQERLRERVDSSGGGAWYEQPAADFSSWNSLGDLLSPDRI
jgi:hypothetical protein